MATYGHKEKAFELPLYMRAVLTQAPDPAVIAVKVGSGQLDLNIGGPGSCTKVGAAVTLAAVAISMASAEGRTPAEELRGIMSMAGDIVGENVKEGGLE